jgi:hypothetical protein
LDAHLGVIGRARLHSRLIKAINGRLCLSVIVSDALACRQRAAILILEFNTGQSFITAGRR